MTQVDTEAVLPPISPLASIDVVIAHHGAAKVLLAALVALLRPRAPRPLAARLSELDNHMRSDIGLPPKAASPPMPHWTHFGF